MSKRLFLSASILFSLVFALPGVASAHTCIPELKATVVDTGGILWNSSSNILTEDGQPLLLGTQGKSKGDVDSESPDGGWVLLDFGCFRDSAGPDLEIFEIGSVEGGEVYVGGLDAKTSLSPRLDGTFTETGWKYVKPTVPPHTDLACDGRETLPESDTKCPLADTWLALDIGKNDEAEYRYVYLWSDGSPKSENVYGGSSDFDVLRAKGAVEGIELSARIDGTTMQPFAGSLAVGANLQFSVKVGAEHVEEPATFDCAVASPYVAKGSLDVSTGVATFDCQYQELGNYVATVVVGDMTRSLDVRVVERNDFLSSSSGTGPVAGEAEQNVLRMFLWGVVLCLLGYGIVSMLRFMNKH